MPNPTPNTDPEIELPTSIGPYQTEGQNPGGLETRIRGFRRG